jgi:tetratricopeptide (TPR) repeat protein
VSVPSPVRPRRLRGSTGAAAVGLAVVITAASWLALHSNTPPIRAVTVLPSLDGLAEAVVTRVRRETTFSAQLGTAGDPSEDAVDAGLRLHAESILTTRVDRSVQPWRVWTQLTRIRDQRRLWSWAFDVPADSPAAGNATIAAKIGFGLGRHLGAVRGGARGGAATVNPMAHDLSLQARVQWRLRTPYSIQQAIMLYERAITIDPGYARAYAGLADCYNLTMSGLTPDVRYPRALKYAEQAVALDPDDAAGHTSLGFLRYKFEWRWNDAGAELKKAISLDPDYALAHHWYGELLGLTGRYEESITQLRLAMALEPDTLAIQSDLVPPLLRSGRVAEARAVVEAAAARNPNWAIVPYRMADIFEAEGRERDAVESRWRWMLMSGVSLEEVDRLRAAYNTGGMEGMTRAEIAGYLESEAATPGAWLNATFLSRLYGRLGERAEAFRWLNIALDRREDAGISLIIHPAYDSLRGDPAFDRALARVGLTAFQRR